MALLAHQLGDGFDAGADRQSLEAVLLLLRHPPGDAAENALEDVRAGDRADLSISMLTRTS
jgi:hypothetical protein